MKKNLFSKVNENNTELYIYGEIHKKDLWDMFLVMMILEQEHLNLKMH